MRQRRDMNIPNYYLNRTALYLIEQTTTLMLQLHKYITLHNINQIFFKKVLIFYRYGNIIIVHHKSDVI